MNIPCNYIQSILRTQILIIRTGTRLIGFYFPRFCSLGKGRPGGKVVQSKIQSSRLVKESGLNLKKKHSIMFENLSCLYLFILKSIITHEFLLVGKNWQH